MNISLPRSIGFSIFAVFGSQSAMAATNAYVGNQENGTISIIDTTRDEVVRTIPERGRIGQKIQAVVATVRGHLDIHDGDVRTVSQYLAAQVVGVPGLGHNLEPGLRQQAHDSLAHEDVVDVNDGLASVELRAHARPHDVALDLLLVP